MDDLQDSDEQLPNLFNALFEFRPREDHSPKENFLSEAFAYVLKTCSGARDAWLSLALGRQVQTTKCKVSTRTSEHYGESSIRFPDMLMEGFLNGDERFKLFSEHKWDSPCKPTQIHEYLKITKDYGDDCQLVFLGASRCQTRDAERSDPRMNGKAFLWEKVFLCFEPLPDKPDILVQFLNFMKTNSLSPGEPIKSESMLAFMKSSNFLAALEHCANKLNNEFQWDFFPKRFQNDKLRKITNRWGRVAIQFETSEWKPTITVGFLFDEQDHRVSFVNPNKGIDLLLRIEADPKDQKNIKPVLDELNCRRKMFKNQAGSFLCLKDAMNGNKHSILIIRSCLGDVIELAPSPIDQPEAIYNVVKGWGKALFDDGKLEKAFQQAGLDSGM